MPKQAGPVVPIGLVFVGAFLTGLGFASAGDGSSADVVVAFTFMLGLSALVLGAVLFFHASK